MKAAGTGAAPSRRPLSCPAAAKPLSIRYGRISSASRLTHAISTTSALPGVQAVRSTEICSASEDSSGAGAYVLRCTGLEVCVAKLCGVHAVWTSESMPASDLARVMLVVRDKVRAAASSAKILRDHAPPNTAPLRSCMRRLQSLRPLLYGTKACRASLPVPAKQQLESDAACPGWASIAMNDTYSRHTRTAGCKSSFLVDVVQCTWSIKLMTTIKQQSPAAAACGAANAALAQAWLSELLPTAAQDTRCQSPDVHGEQEQLSIDIIINHVSRAAYRIHGCSVCRHAASLHVLQVISSTASSTAGGCELNATSVPSETGRMLL